jgi:hypothetical protein
LVRSEKELHKRRTVTGDGSGFSLSKTPFSTSAAQKLGVGKSSHGPRPHIEHGAQGTDVDMTSDCKNQPASQSQFKIRLWGPGSLCLIEASLSQIYASSLWQEPCTEDGLCNFQVAHP